MNILKFVLAVVVASFIITSCNSGGINRESSITPILKSDDVNNLSLQLDDIDKFEDANKIELINKLVLLSSSLDLLQSKRLYLQYANGIYFGEFGNSTEVIKAIALSLGQLNITDSYTQYLIARAIQENKFGDNRETINILIDSLSKMTVTDEDTQNALIIAFNNGVFGNDKKVWHHIMTNWKLTHDMNVKWSWLLNS